MKKISSGVLFLLFYGNLLAQYAKLKFENLSTIDGLSSTCVEIRQDHDGFLWFGTINGLNKYDGYEFTVCRSVINDPHSISSNRIYCIEEDNLGRLWIGTGNGLNVFDKASEKFSRISYSSTRSRRSAIWQDSILLPTSARPLGNCLAKHLSSTEEHAKEKNE